MAVVRAMELVGSSKALASYLGVTSRHVIRWMLGKELVPDATRVKLTALLKMPPNDVARTLHITRDELERRARRRS